MRSCFLLAIGLLLSVCPATLNAGISVSAGDFSYQNAGSTLVHGNSTNYLAQGTDQWFLAVTYTRESALGGGGIVQESSAVVVAFPSPVGAMPGTTDSQTSQFKFQASGLGPTATFHTIDLTLDYLLDTAGTLTTDGSLSYSGPSGFSLISATLVNSFEYEGVSTTFGSPLPGPGSVTWQDPTIAITRSTTDATSVVPGGFAINGTGTGLVADGDASRASFVWDLDVSNLSANSVSSQTTLTFAPLTAVPEPTSLALVGMAGLAFLRRRRR